MTEKQCPYCGKKTDSVKDVDHEEFDDPGCTNCRKFIETRGEASG